MKQLKLIIATLFLISPFAASAGLIGLSSTGPGVAYSIDPVTGEATEFVVLSDSLSFTGASFLDGTLYGSDVCGADCFSLDSIDLDTGITTFVSDQDGSANWHGLASDEDAGLLYAIDINDGLLLKSLTADGIVASIGTGTGIDGRGMAYDDFNDILYATGSGSLYTVDTSTGVSSLIGSLGFGDNFRIGLAFDELTGTLYANSAGGLWSLSTDNGAGTLIGGNGVEGIDGLAWFGSTAVPEPGTLALLSLGLVGMAARRRKKV